ncbi:hypothetical protein [Thiomicrorhabdus xiamenensis]|uniref:SpoIIAA-like n=1 Tax=Thiomicrorhabdus xiamenensis TaxID=2739063 RepID=A0A7D4P3Q8_9GAMM|nr:hypothetical protein [Thiomicrorhabdus xiamenensis]QKI88335.1 hypothetical protein HQN79_01450 [Thiomicrorhabdus xiamenensis]
MGFTLHRDDENNLLHAHYEKETSYQDRIDLLDQLIEVLKIQPMMNVLINVSEAESHMSDDEQLEYGKRLARHAHYFLRNKTAIVKKHHNPHPFILVSAYAEGLDSIVEFSKVTEALAWINGEIS